MKSAIFALVILQFASSSMAYSRHAWFEGNELFAQGISSQPETVAARKEALTDALTLAQEALYGVEIVSSAKSLLRSRQGGNGGDFQHEYNDFTEKKNIQSMSPLHYVIIASRLEPDGLYSVLIRVSARDSLRAQKARLALDTVKQGYSGLKCKRGIPPDLCRSSAKEMMSTLAASQISINPSSPYALGLATRTSLVGSSACTRESVGELIIIEPKEECWGHAVITVELSLLDNDQQLFSRRSESLQCEFPEGTGIQATNGYPIFDDWAAGNLCREKIADVVGRTMHQYFPPQKGENP